MNSNGNGNSGPAMRTVDSRIAAIDGAVRQLEIRNNKIKELSLSGKLDFGLIRRAYDRSAEIFYKQVEEQAKNLMKI